MIKDGDGRQVLLLPSPFCFCCWIAIGNRQRGESGRPSVGGMSSLKSRITPVEPAPCFVAMVELSRAGNAPALANLGLERGTPEIGCSKCPVFYIFDISPSR